MILLKVRKFTPPKKCPFKTEELFLLFIVKNKVKSFPRYWTRQLMYFIILMKSNLTGQLNERMSCL